jgi:hypothetical protein
VIYSTTISRSSWLAPAALGAAMSRLSCPPGAGARAVDNHDLKAPDCVERDLADHRVAVSRSR